MLCRLGQVSSSYSGVQALDADRSHTNIYFCPEDLDRLLWFFSSFVSRTLPIATSTPRGSESHQAHSCRAGDGAVWSSRTDRRLVVFPARALAAMIARSTVTAWVPNERF